MTTINRSSALAFLISSSNTSWLEGAGARIAGQADGASRNALRDQAIRSVREYDDGIGRHQNVISPADPDGVSRASPVQRYFWTSR
jgi:hypothetical protein